jgi:hypothetical protein
VLLAPNDTAELVAELRDMTYQPHRRHEPTLEELEHRFVAQLHAEREAEWARHPERLVCEQLFESYRRLVT